jgi:hypothetical protein
MKAWVIPEQFRGIEVEPPAPCIPKRLGSMGASTTSTSSQRAPSSSAVTIGRAVLMPWPIAGVAA